MIDSDHHFGWTLPGYSNMYLHDIKYIDYRLY